jgi:molybdopterin synthase catalytic subunit
MYFRLTRDPIPWRLIDSSAEAGALTSFVGQVRNHNDGQRVLSLEYESYEELALKEGAQILLEAMDRFSILDAACIHRVGVLEIGEVAIRVEVASGHRQDAFAACSWIVDEVKSRVPIWKKEHYESGASEWLNPLADTTASPSDVSPAPALETQIKAGFESNDEIELAPKDLSAFRVLDIREEAEIMTEPSPWHLTEWLPMSEWNDSSIDERPTLIVCAHGVRSWRVTAHLRSIGHQNVFSLPGGLDTLRQLT